MSIGLQPTKTDNVVSLRALSKNSKKKIDKKSGRKQPRANDYGIEFEPAPDSQFSINTPLKQKLMTTPSTNGSIKPNKTPKISTVFSTPKSKKKLELSVIEEDAGETHIIDEKKNSTEINKSLPVKKRKIDDINLDEMETPTKKTKTLSDLPWVAYCSQQHKQNILNNNYLCSDIIISTQNLLKFEFPEINGFQETTLAPVKLNGKWVSETGFQSQESPSLQIHHNGNAHWVLSLQTRDGNIYLLDSLSLNLTTSLEYQLTQIYGKDKKKLIIRIPDVQKQQNSIDCGLFAIANALEFCQTGFKGGTHITYEQKYMREHLIHCLENGKFTHFPKNNFGKTPKNLKTKTHIISINCDCGKPDTIEDMVGCEGKTGRKMCDVWTHRSCAKKNMKENSWFCEVHR
ncbi:unnamed protein product [Mytilus edulis]|uniref:Ubiquitin-like protease family profile domain-containing protein n=1 Tax=Mytilus edulis TaxID=6550 RepID=A0A8S3TGX6_MYTED|nr:unnamed protein product [Mytilus edulis]